METKRLFLAIPVHDEMQKICDEFIGYQNIKTRWVPPGMRHITLVFIGSFPLVLVNKLILFLEKEIQAFHPFCLEFDKCTFMPSGKPLMIWAQFRKDTVFDRYVSKTDNVLRSFFQEHHLKYKIKVKKNNIPHITLSRLKNYYPKLSIRKIAGESTKICMPVSRIQLIESQLLPKGATYFLLHDFGLEPEIKM
jgi:2'-5' RNA ligase